MATVDLAGAAGKREIGVASRALGHDLAPGDDAKTLGAEPQRLDHPWAGNVVALCPVGSLLSKDFLH